MATSLQDQPNIIAGDNFVICRKDDGTLWGIGSNGYGQLGLSSSIGSVSKWTKIPIPKVAKIFNGREYGQYSVFAILENGDLYSTGYNSGYCQLGYSSGHKYGFTRVSLDNVTAVFAGNYGSAFITTNKVLYFTGHGRYLGGLKDTTTMTTPTAASTALVNIIDACYFNANSRMMYLRDNGSWYVTNSAVSGVTNTAAVSEYVYKGLTSDAAKICHPIGRTDWVVYVTTNGALKTLGNNSYGQLGNGNTTNSNAAWQTPSISDIKQIALGYGHIVVLKTDGSVYTCGLNNYHQLGIDSIATTNQSKFLKADIKFPVVSVQAGLYTTYYRLPGDLVSYSVL